MLEIINQTFIAVGYYSGPILKKIKEFYCIGSFYNSERSNGDLFFKTVTSILQDVLKSSRT